MKYLDRLAWCEAMRSFNFKDENEYIAEQEKAIKHFATVIENTADEKIKTSSVQGINVGAFIERPRATTGRPYKFVFYGR